MKIRDLHLYFQDHCDHTYMINRSSQQFDDNHRELSPNPSSTRKRPFQEAGRHWQERKLRVSGRASAAPENSAKVKGERRRHRHVTGGVDVFLFWGEIGWWLSCYGFLTWFCVMLLFADVLVMFLLVEFGWSVPVYLLLKV